VVFGARAAQAMKADNLPLISIENKPDAKFPMEAGDDDEVEQQVNLLRRTMWADGGLLRSEQSLLNVLQIQRECDAVLSRFSESGKAGRRLFEAQSLCRVARAIGCSAVNRKESRGAHFRRDFPARDDVNFRKHSIYGQSDLVTFEDL
jgi:succinate dehydrogenase/fumarate reductase flavoprotein subunit